jgi:hypothetical protein
MPPCINLSLIYLSPPDKNDICPDNYDARMLAFLDTMNLTDSDSDDCSNATDLSSPSEFPSNARPKGHCSSSITPSVPIQSSGPSYMAVTTSSRGSAPPHP